jgi:hypothetical protein
MLEDMAARKLMQDMTAIEVKAFVPSKDFALSKHFYQDLDFNLGWSSNELAYLHKAIQASSCRTST